MDYEKAYKEALERAKKLYEQGTITESLAYIFPELTESEDERTRKEIINYFQCQSEEEPTRKEIHNKWIAWLEKQGKKMSDPRYSILDKLIEADDIYQMSVNAEMIETAKNKAIDALSKLEITKLLEDKKQGERKIPKWIFDFLEECRPYIGCALGYDERRDIEGKVVAVGNKAEKDNELTWEDIEAIDQIFTDVFKDGFDVITNKYYQEVLKRFKERKGE